MDFSAPQKSRRSATQLQVQLSQLTDRTRLRRLKSSPLQRCLAAGYEDRRLVCRTHVSHKWLHHLDACAGSVLTPHDYITNAQQRLGNGVWVGGGQCRCCGSFLDPQLEHAETCSTAEETRGHYACVHAVVGGLKFADPGITTEPRGLTASQSRLADIFTATAVPGCGAALDVCVASSIAAAARGETAQAASDRKLSHHRNEFVELTRTRQYAADIASSRNGQQMSAKSLQRRWKREIRIALPRRRADMARAVLPNPSARAEWLLAGFVDRSLHHWGHASLLTVDPATTTMPTPRLTQQLPDVDDDIASLASCSFESLQPSSLQPLFPPIRCGLCLVGDGFPG